MILSDKERVTTFLIGILFGCLIVAGLLERRNQRKASHEEISNAPVPEWAQPLPEGLPIALRRGRIKEFKENEGTKARSWLVEYEDNYPFVLIEEDPANDPTTLKYTAADRIITTPKPSTTYKDYQDQLIQLQLQPREHFKKKGIIIVGILDPTIDKLPATLETLQKHPLIQSASLDHIEVRKEERPVFSPPGQFLSPARDETQDTQKSGS
jgi:hypothetical protein